MTSEDEYYWGLVEEIDTHGSGLSHWEVDFVDNLLSADENFELSTAQKSKIGQIHHERVE